LAARSTGQHLHPSLRANVFTKYVHLALGAKAQQKPFLRAKMWVLEVGKDEGEMEIKVGDWERGGEAEDDIRTKNYEQSFFVFMFSWKS
jgi:hypothetical protein